MAPDKDIQRALEKLVEQIHKCRVCAAHLPLGPRPVVHLHSQARILIIGQAPGRRVHESGISWDDPSGDRLRQWMGIDRSVFYDDHNIAIMASGFCYPGKHERGGDKPPRPECTPLWHPQIRPLLPHIQLTLLVGAYAQKNYLQKAAKSTLTETVRHWRDYLPEFLPLPHPSPRNGAWFQRHPWFEEETVPFLRERIHALLEL
ncbi:MAG: uracil-DNA glycosylase family protein [Candidatus Hydrogenedens sp.]|nr:uracil-DNA glycosylase family protein [Candidatus Hydrogenedens sp.]